MEPQPGEGVVQLPLTTQGPEGQLYRLVGATFTITGPKSVTLTDDSPAPTVSVALPAGAYTIQLTPGWSMERQGATPETVQASLVSPNPLPFTIQEGQTRTVRFVFKLPGNGNADVGFTVDTGGWISGTFEFPPLTGPSNGNPFEVLAGTSVPFIISYETAMLTRQDSFEKTLVVQTSPITLQFGGTYSELLHERVTQAFNGSPISFSIRAMNNDGRSIFYGFQLFSTQGEEFNLTVHPGLPFSGVLDAEGYPTARPFQLDSYYSLHKPGTPSGQVSGPLTGSVNPQ
ncbi:hypothetical protein ACLESD_17870 [Pyxidicoccus sp. 3LFB2]